MVTRILIAGAVGYFAGDKVTEFAIGTGASVAGFSGGVSEQVMAKYGGVGKVATGVVAYWLLGKL